MEETKCSHCKNKMPKSGGFYAARFGMPEGLHVTAVIAGPYSPEAFVNALCGLRCLSLWFNDEAGKLVGLSPTFPKREAEGVLP